MSSKLPPDPYEQNAEIDDLKQQMTVLRQTVMQLAEVTTIDKALVRGFETLCAQLQPLQDLAFPAREPLKPEKSTQLQALRDLLAKPDWSGAGELDVLFVGGAVTGPARPPTQAANRTQEGRATS